ncbi:MAG: MFS transporter [Candidatus Omnitrophica bacterium]|nr:MFS transporter [Candidatus Omnitrophota bacterium]
MIAFLKNKDNWPFLRFWLAQLISQFGDRVHQMALVGLIAMRHPGSSFELAKLLAFTIVPVFIIGPIAGVYVDRWERRTTLFICDFVRGILVLAIAFYVMDLPSILPVYALVFIIFAFSRFYVPAKMSFIPEMVKEEDLHIANSLVTVTGMIALVLGALFGGLIVERAGPRGGFVWDAATFFFSGLLVFSIPRLKKWYRERPGALTAGRAMLAAHKTVWAEIVEGIDYIRSQKEIRFIFIMMSVLFAAAGAVYVVIIVFIQQALNSVTKDLGFLAVPLGAGLFLGSLAYGKCGDRISKWKTMFWSLILGGGLVACFAAAVHTTHSRGLAAGLAFVLGFVVGPVVIASNTVVHTVCAAHMSGKVFSALEFVMHLAFLMAMLASSYAAEFVSRAWILMGVGVIFLGVGVIGLLNSRGERPFAPINMGK